jgi:hypothetical protein
MSAPALAAAPEAPEVSVEDTTAVVATPSTEVVLHGVLNPAATEPSEAGVYKFLYKAGPTCTGGSETSPDISMGAEAEQVSEPISGLTAGTEYTVCLVVRNSEFVPKEATSAPEHFTTATPPEVPVTKSPAASITATTATFEGTLNPVKAGNAGTYEFYYQQSASECNPEHVAPEPAGTMTGISPQVVSPVPVTGLEPNTEYTFCLVATNAAGETIVGNAVPFKTLKAKPTVISESAGPRAEEVSLNATVNASNEATECNFQYGEVSVSEHTVACEQGTPPGTLEGGEQGVAVTVTDLKQNTVYHYRVVVKNATGEVKGTGVAAEEEFRTAIHPETPTGLKAEAITTTTATLHGVLNPKAAGNAGSYEFLYRESPTECEGAGEQRTGALPALGGKEEAVKTEPGLENLIPNTAYTYCLRVHNEVGEEATSAPVTFTTLVAPLEIKSESDTVVSSTEARLEAEIYDGNSEASYHFEYGPAAGDYTVSIPAPDGHIHASLEGRSVSAAAIGLEPGTTYHYRVVAANALPGEVDGPDHEFTTPATQPTGTTPGNCANEQRRAEQPYGLNLPDCRAYEMVSPLETLGNDATTGEDVRAGASGGAITYASRGAFAGTAASVYNNQLLSRREAEHDRWSTRAIAPPYEANETEDFTTGYRGAFFTADLEAGLTATTAPLTSSPETAPVGLQELYRADLTSSPSSYRLVSQLPPSEELYAPPHAGTNSAIYPLGASSDLTHVVFSTNDESEAGPLHEWVNGQVGFVAVPNKEGEMWPGATLGNGTPLTFNEYQDVWRAVSEDGSRVIFRNEGQLYMRQHGVEQKQSKMKEPGLPGEECLEPAKACTIKLSSGSAAYVGASTDATKIFYIENGDLYEYELPIGSVKGKATLAHSGEVQGVVQISEDGSYVYFVANGVLGDGAADGATPGNCGVENRGGAVEPTGTACNLYVSHVGGEPSFIATLSAKDGYDWVRGPGQHNALAPGAAGGAHLAFVSEDSLPTTNFPTGYDNEQAETGECSGENGKCKEVYLYDAETGALVCASCNPSGARPVGSAGLANAGTEVPTEYDPRDLLADGRLFFDSSDALVPHASDGRQNVYEYEDGHVYAISNVAGGQNSSFLDASPNGQDVFFASSDQLLPEDTGDNSVVWDAREGGGFPVTVAAPPCTTAEACRTASGGRESNQSVFGTPPSATFSGPGNIAPPPPAVVKPKPKTAAQLKAEKLAKALKTCRKDKKKSKRAKCEKQAKQKYGAQKSAKKSSDNRRTH